MIKLVSVVVGAVGFCLGFLVAKFNKHGEASAVLVNCNSPPECKYLYRIGSAGTVDFEYRGEWHYGVCGIWHSCETGARQNEEALYFIWDQFKQLKENHPDEFKEKFLLVEIARD